MSEAGQAAQQGPLHFRFTGSDGIPLHSFHDGSSPVQDERLLAGFLAAMNGLLGLSAGHLMELPQNYSLRQLPSGTLALYGHPRYFLSNARALILTSFSNSFER
jgi:hypothetical protein